MRSRLTNKRGSNQYQTRQKDAWVEIIIVFFLILALAVSVGGELKYHRQAYAQEQDVYISPMAKLQIADTYHLDHVLTPVEAQDWEGMKLMARRMAPIYSYPVKVVIAQMALESGRGTSEFCQVRQNCFGLAAYDSNPDAAWRFETKEQGMIEYFRLIRDNFPEAWASRNDPDRMIELLEHNDSGLMYATDPNYVQKLRSLPEWNEE